MQCGCDGADAPCFFLCPKIASPSMARTQPRKKAGRPKGSVTVPNSRTVGLRLQARHLDAIDAWASERGLKTRSAAVRDLLEKVAE